MHHSIFYCLPGWELGTTPKPSINLRTGSQRERKKKFGDRKRDSVSEASGSRSRESDRSRLVPLTLDYTRLACSKTNRKPVRRLALHPPQNQGIRIIWPNRQNDKYIDGIWDFTALREAGLAKIWARVARFFCLSVRNSGNRNVPKKTFWLIGLNKRPWLNSYLSETVAVCILFQPDARKVHVAPWYTSYWPDVQLTQKLKLSSVFG